MKKIQSSIIAAAAALLCAASCVYEFNAYPSTSDDYQFLVVDGMINVGEVSSFNLLYSVALDAASMPSYPIYENPYELRVEDEDGMVYEGVRDKSITSSYHYDVDTRDVPKGKACRVVIQEKNGTNKYTYVSDFSVAKEGAVIDSVYEKQNSETLACEIYVDFHNDAPGEKYFLWKYKETWEYHPYYMAEVKCTGLRNGKPVYEELDTNLFYYCWNTYESSEILLATTDNLKENTLKGHQLYSVPRGNMKLSTLYASDVQLYTIDAAAYKYWKTMRSNSVETNSILSAQPSELKGNIVCRQNPDVVVLGYVGAVHADTRRIFVRNGSPNVYVQGYDYYHEDMQLPDGESAEELEDAWQAILAGGYYLPVTASPELWASARCVDCTKSGGNKNKPDWWPNSHE